jgi:hypothetical protein
VDPVKLEFDFTLGGKAFKFKFGLAAVAHAQELLREPNGTLPTVQQIDERLTRGSLLYLRAMIYGGLRKHHASLTIDDVDGLLEQITEPEAKNLLAACGFSLTPDPADVAVLGVPTNGNGNPQMAQAPKTARRSRGRSTSKPAVTA